MSSFYITTPIYYVNGAPHIGHAYTTIVADAFARHHRQRGDDVFFMTGTDEHGLKVQRAAEEAGISPKELADQNSAKFKELFELYGLTHDRFIRTTDDDHRAVVTEVVNRMKAAGDIYLGSYEGWYAAADEAFLDESEIENGFAIESGAAVEWVEEKSYFFRLSKYKEPLLAYYETPGAVAPSSRKNEVVSFVSGDLRDLSISRTTFDWGIPWPDDPDHVLYVWVDALTNYITGVGAFSDAERFERYWPCDVHLIGKDILRFHAVYWPAFLMSAGVEVPKQIFAHGWWMNDGWKMGKRSGNVIDAFDLADAYDLDVLRYYLMREAPLGNDGNFKHERLLERNNAELADNLGNLLNRTVSMTQRFAGGEIAPPGSDGEDGSVREAAEACKSAVLASMDAREPHKALELALGFAGDLNQYIQSTQPWKLNKEGDTARAATVLGTALEGLRWVGVLLHAFMPGKCDRLLAALGLPTEAAPALETLQWGAAPAGRTVEPGGVLFEKYEIEKVEPAPKQKKQKQQAPKAEKKAEAKSDDGLINFMDFLRVDLRAGLVRAAETVEDADKLLKLSVDLGEASPRIVVAGLAKSFAPEDLVGKTIAVVGNLERRKIFGIESQAMVLAAEDADGKLNLAVLSDSVPPGTKIS